MIYPITNGNMQTTIPTLILGMQVIGSSLANPTKSASLFEAHPPSKSLSKFLPPSSDSTNTKTIRTLDETPEKITQEQVECAERLGVDIKECNQHGVFTNRTPQIAQALLKKFGTDSWDDITPIVLYKIKHSNNLFFGSTGIESIKRNDFHGLNNLDVLYLADNNITKIEEGAFSHFKALRNIYLQQNYNLKTLPEDIFNTLPIASKTNPLENLNIQLDRTSITLSVDQFRTLWEKNAGIVYSWPSWETDTKLEQNSIKIGDDSFTLSVHQFARFIAGENTYLISDGQSFKLGTLKDSALLSFIHPQEDNKKSLTKKDTSSKESAPSTPRHSSKRNTDSQNECAERLNVQVSDCNQQGVFINRTDQIANAILRKLQTHSWDNVTPKNLRSIVNNLLINGKAIQTIKRNDFDGLSQLREVFLGKNNITEIEEGAFSPLKNIKYLDLQQNYYLKTLPKDIFNNFPKTVNPGSFNHAEAYLDQTALILSVDQFRTLWEKNVGITYSFSDSGSDKELQQNSIKVGDSSHALSIHQFASYISGKNKCLTSDSESILLGNLKDSALLCFVFKDNCSSDQKFTDNCSYGQKDSSLPVQASLTTLLFLIALSMIAANEPS